MSITSGRKDEAEAKASSMIGHKLITKQTGSKGNICNSVAIWRF